MFYDVADVKKYSRISVAVVVFYKVGKSDEISELDEDIVECVLTEVAGEYSESQSEFKRVIGSFFEFSDFPFFIADFLFVFSAEAEVECRSGFDTYNVFKVILI